MCIEQGATSATRHLTRPLTFAPTQEPSRHAHPIITTAKRKTVATHRQKKRLDKVKVRG